MTFFFSIISIIIGAAIGFVSASARESANRRHRFRYLMAVLKSDLEQLPEPRPPCTDISVVEFADKTEREVRVEGAKVRFDICKSKRTLFDSACADYYMMRKRSGPQLVDSMLKDPLSTGQVNYRSGKQRLLDALDRMIELTAHPLDCSFLHGD